MEKKSLLNKWLRQLGFELINYSPKSSDFARMQRIFSYHKIDLVLDIGANIGQYAQKIREAGYSGRIVSFEPLSTAYSKLQKISHKDSLWEIAPRMALGSAEGEIKINIAANSYSSSVLDILDSHLKAAPTSVYISSEQVKVNRLDCVIPNYIKNETNSIFMKIDVQGFEKQVLEGATGILSQVNGVQLELSLTPLYKDQLLFKDMLMLMEELGYELYAVVPGFTNLETGRLLQMDGIFFKK